MTQEGDAGSSGTEANFDRVAGVYRWAEYLALGPALRLTRESLLPAITRCRSALLLGDGDGRFAVALLRAAPAVRVRAVDTSARMLRTLQRRCAREGHGDRVNIQRASVLEAQPPAQCDLITAHFLLDCLTQEQVYALACRLREQVGAGTLWVVSDFDLPRHPLLRAAASIYIRALYLAFRLLTGLRVQQLPSVPEALHAAGWRRLQRKERLRGLLYSELWQSGAAESSPGPDCATSTVARTSTHG